MSEFDYGEIAKQVEREEERISGERERIKTTIKKMLPGYKVNRIRRLYPPTGETMWEMSIIKKAAVSPPPLGINVTDGIGSKDELR